jgi:hypothetical protein
MIDTDCMNELFPCQFLPVKTIAFDVHVSSQQFDLKRHNRLSQPNDREDAGKDEIGLILACSGGQEHAEQKTKN